MSDIKVYYVGDHQTIRYAAGELKNYLERMNGERVLITPRQAYEDEAAGAIWIGLASAFPEIRFPEVKDPEVDDALYIKVRGREGVIAGVNPRSVLLGVYRYLTELGCRWIRPGADGEFIPGVTLDDTSVEVREAAAYRHRGICIEGAVSYEHVRDIIEWAPRVGFNGYFIQFREGYTFFERWYSHQNNPLKTPEEFSVEEARRLVTMAADEIKKRDLLYHGVGHGWTCEPLGFPGLGWDPVEEEVPPEVSRYLALVNGERKFWHKVPLNTNLCYSNREVRRLVTAEIADYAQAHPEIDILHFWLADGFNNQCECDECRTARPADFYVKMLNELDELLSERGLKTRIVFLIYVDLLWPPEKEVIRNPDRFILMFAPITRTYSKPFTPAKPLPSLPPYKRNRLVFPRDVEENVAFLRGWQDIFKGDSFDFDYHYMWDHYNDPGYVRMAEVLYEDIQHLKDIGLNGYVSCQTQRAFFPTGFGMMLMGWALWRTDLPFETIAREYFSAAFGPDWEECYAYLRRLSDLFNPPYLRGEEPRVNEAAAASFARVPQVIEDFTPVIARNIESPEKCWSASWRYLKEHALLSKLLASALEARARGDMDMARTRWGTLKRLVQEREDLLHHVLDIWLFIQTLERKWFSPA